MKNQAIQRTFATEKYKRFWYPNRPLFTLMLGISLSTLGVIGMLPLSWALWLAAAFAFDDLPLIPIMSVIKSINNLLNGRKQFKSVVMLISISIASLTGAFLGYFLLSQSPFFYTAITSFINNTGCSPIFISIGAISFGMLAHVTNKLSPFSGILLGAFLASFIPPTLVPFTVEAVFIAGAGMAFLTTIVTKQCLRAYYYTKYGHTNADGYQMHRAETEQTDFIAAQATKFNVTVEQFNTMLEYCKNQIQHIKNSAHLFQEVSGERVSTSNAFKDIYFGLMSQNPNVAEIKDLIFNSSPSLIKEAQNSRPGIDPDFYLAFVSNAKLKSDINERLYYHQLQFFKGSGINPSDALKQDDFECFKP